MNINISLKIAIFISVLIGHTLEYCILKSGFPLNNKSKVIAKQIGIKHPEKIRILFVSRINKNILAITFGYGILIKRGHFSTELLIHELIHVRQYEEIGGINNETRN